MNLTSKQWQLLSAYLDGELSDREQRQVKSLLTADSQAALALENLRNTKALLRLLPMRQVPRQYTLTRQEALAYRPGWLVNSLRVLSGVSAAALVVLLAVDLLLPARIPPPAAMLESMAMEEAPAAESMAAPLDEVQSEPFNFQPAPHGRGMGGGGGTEGEPAPSSDLILPDISIREGETYPIDAASSEITEDAAELDFDISESKRSQDTGPILGIAPYDQQGSIREPEMPLSLPGELPIQSPLGLSYLTFEILLLSFALLSLLVAFLIRRYRRTVH